MRVGKESDEQLRQRRDKLLLQLAKAKADLKDAEDRNDLRDYRLADYHVTSIESEIDSINEKLHPYGAGVFGNKCHPSKHK